MSKYTRQQLQQMAKRVLEARDSGDQRYPLIMMTMAIHTRFSPEQVKLKIKALVRGD